eukprot:5221506-Alexandrium_andersonii.AAC.1
MLRVLRSPHVRCCRCPIMPDADVLHAWWKGCGSQKHVRTGPVVSPLPTGKPLLAGTCRSSVLPCKAPGCRLDTASSGSQRFEVVSAGPT